MDTISHLLCGAVIARAGFEDRLGKRTALLAGALAAIAPDLDIVSMLFFGRDHYMMWHGGLTHSLLAWLLFTTLLAALLSRLAKVAFQPMWLLCGLAYASHLGMDVFTSWGTMLFLPFDDTRFAAAWVYGVDLFFWFILSLPFWMDRVLGEPALLARFSLFALGVYIGICGLLHREAKQVVERTATANGYAPVRVAVYPSPFLPVFWNGVFDDGEFLHQGPVQVPFGAAPTLANQRLKNFEHPAVVAVLKEPLARRFVHWWADSPVAEVRCQGTARYVVLTDLRYRSPWLTGPGFSQVWEVTYDSRTSSYTPKGSRWLTPWYGEPVPDGDCRLRMEIDMSNDAGRRRAKAAQER